uniref:cyclic pyranopterin monophosphate synthase MoaC n=1 Tax=Ndongobacter massiliensis TaxID=1871025 RepID=UPI0009306FBF|nr:cyclic pyranopterin monophosphate synthase MoaC [Ndongobacter massiliensis]
MVDVSEKKETNRLAYAEGRVKLNRETYELVKNQGIKKGDVLAVARVAGIMAAKNTAGIIPMCHPINITCVEITFALDDPGHFIDIGCTVKIDARTGVEMEALTAVSVAALTIYDMCKAVQRDIEISDIRLIRKSGGKSGDFVRKEADK